MKKYREIWINPQKGTDCEWTNLYPDESWNTPSKPLQCFIEKSALDDLKAENERLRDALENMNCDYRLISTSGGTVASHIDSCRRCNALSPQEKE